MHKEASFHHLCPLAIAAIAQKKGAIVIGSLRRVAFVV